MSVKKKPIIPERLQPVIAFLIVIAAVYFICNLPTSKAYLYNQDTETTINLRQSWHSLNSKLGTPKQVDTTTGTIYCFQNDLYVAFFTGNKATSLYTESPSSRWKTMTEISIGMSAESVEQRMGKPLNIGKANGAFFPEKPGDWWSYQRGNAYIISFRMLEDRVDAIYIEYPIWMLISM